MVLREPYTVAVHAPFIFPLFAVVEANINDVRFLLKNPSIVRKFLTKSNLFRADFFIS